MRPRLDGGLGKGKDACPDSLLLLPTTRAQVMRNARDSVTSVTVTERCALQAWAPGWLASPLPGRFHLRTRSVSSCASRLQEHSFCIPNPSTPLPLPLSAEILAGGRADSFAPLPAAAQSLLICTLLPSTPQRRDPGGQRGRRGAALRRAHGPPVCRRAAPRRDLRQGCVTWASWPGLVLSSCLLADGLHHLRQGCCAAWV